jgi:large subunit ribosomal protein L6
MKKLIKQIIEIPEGVEANINGNFVSVKGTEGENKREFKFGNLEIKKENNKIIISREKATKKEKKQINTFSAHLKNMIKGVKEKFEYKLKICFSHFPMTVDIKENEVIIKNFLGEKIPRISKIPKGAEIKIKGQNITINSLDKEIAGQAAANFEKATKITGRDRRVFQDGIFITEKAGREI